MNEPNKEYFGECNFIKTSRNNKEYFYCNVAKYKIIHGEKYYICSELYEINESSYKSKIFDETNSLFIRKHESDFGIYHGFVCSARKATFGKDPMYDLFPLSGSREEIVRDGTFQIGTYCKIRLNSKDFEFVR